MKAQSVANLCAALLIMLGSLVICGWVFHIPSLVQIFPGLIGMVMNTAINFVLLGVVLFLLNKSSLQHRFKLILVRILLLYILIIALVSLIQDIFSINLGIDRMFVHPWLKDPSPTPGRM